MQSNFTIALTVAAATASMSSGALIPFTEDFDTDSSNWFNAAGSAPVDWSPAGGPDGGAHASTGFNFGLSTADDTPVLFRAQDEFNSSAGAFEGDWISEGVTEFTFDVRHTAPEPLTFFARFSSPFNFPGATAIGFSPVFPNVWTTISIAIDPANPQFISFEGQTFGDVFSNIGHVQIGVSVSESLAGVDQTFGFDLDKPTIVPVPGAGAVLALAGLVTMRRRR